MAEFDRCPGCEPLDALVDSGRDDPGKKYGLRAVLWPNRKG